MLLKFLNNCKGWFIGRRIARGGGGSSTYADAPVHDIFNALSLTKNLVEAHRLNIRDGISPQAKFFEIGGKSLHVPLVVIQLRKKFDIEISIVDMFQYPSIELLAELIDKRLGGIQDSEALTSPKRRIHKTGFGTNLKRRAIAAGKLSRLNKNR